jgi:hypothetical protein
MHYGKHNNKNNNNNNNGGVGIMLSIATFWRLLRLLLLLHPTCIAFVKNVDLVFILDGRAHE